MRKIINIIGLPGSGKTTLAKLIAPQLNAVHINADWARETITSHLGFTPEDRVRQASTLGEIAALIQPHQWVVTDFVNPTSETRGAFTKAADPFARGLVYTVFMNTIEKGRFDDTNRLFVPLSYAEAKVNDWIEADEFPTLARDIVADITRGMRQFDIRFNTKHEGSPLKWRIIESQTGSERLASDFDIRGHLTPSQTWENGVEKYNVSAKGFPRWEGSKFILEF